MGDNRLINNLFLKIRTKTFKVLLYTYKVIHQPTFTLFILVHEAESNKADIECRSWGGLNCHLSPPLKCRFIVKLWKVVKQIFKDNTYNAKNVIWQIAPADLSRCYSSFDRGPASRRQTWRPQHLSKIFHKSKWLKLFFKIDT